VDVVCKNRFGCGDRVLKEVEYFLRTLGAENITVKTLEKMGVWSIEDAYEMDETDILNIEGFGSKSASIVVSEIQNTLSTTPEKLLQAFGIPGVGKEIAKSLLRCFGSIENILDSDEDMLKQCEGVGPKIAENITRESSLCYDIYKYLLSIGLTLFNNKEENKKMLEGKQFALTGKGLLTREQISFLIESAGGIVKGMNKSTNYLVTSDMSSQSGKMKKAEEYGVQVISYEDLMDMLKEGGVLSAFM
jgi:DNA ligase (NAD+)